MLYLIVVFVAVAVDAANHTNVICNCKSDISYHVLVVMVGCVGVVFGCGCGVVVVIVVVVAEVTVVVEEEAVLVIGSFTCDVNGCPVVL